MSYDEFMHHSYYELSFILDAYKRKKDLDYKIKLQDNYFLASQIACFVGCILSGKQIPTIEEVYPNEFETKSKDEIAFIQFKELADAMNKNRKDRHES